MRTLLAAIVCCSFYEEEIALERAGVAAIRKPGASTREIVDRANIRPRHEGA